MQNTKDHLDTGISIEASLKESGVELRANSRAVSGLDRLLGNLSELVNAPMERRTARIRADQKLIEALSDAAVARIQQDHTLVDRMVRAQMGQMAARYMNKEVVAQLALEELAANPPSAEQNAAGPERLDSAFLNRFERFAEDATDDAAREKWAKILTGEIRKPGTFTAKVLRVIDEIQPNVAQLFEDVSQHRVGDCIPIGLIGELPFTSLRQLETAGLVEPSETGLSRIFPSVANNRGINSWIGDFGYGVLAIPASAKISKRPRESDLYLQEPGKFSTLTEPRVVCPIYLLTDEAVALLNIIEDRQALAWERLLQHFSNTLPGVEIQELTEREGGGYKILRTIVGRETEASQV